VTRLPVILLLALAAALVVSVAAGAQPPPPQKSVQLAVVTHGEASDSFWVVVKNGIEEASRETGTVVSYHAPDSYDPRRMRELLDAVVATRPDGLIVSIPDAKVLGPSIRRAVKSGIPVVAINAGEDSYRRLGALLFVGQPEFQAGYAAGRRLAAAGVRDAICVNHQPGVASLDARCRGFAAGLAKSGGTSQLVTVRLQDQRDAVKRISAALSSSDVDGILSLGPGGATPTLAALKATKKLKKVKFATFDLAPDILRGVSSGQILFAIDQQPYLQGYLPVVLLTQYVQYGLLPARGSVVATGPAFVSKREAARVIELTRQGLR
jgi:simple sugar transport system substrate-binding protein